MAEKDYSISHLIKNITKQQFDAKGVHLVKLLEDWDLIITPDFQKNTYPYKINWDNNNQGILYIHISNKLVAPMLSAHSGSIIEKINQYFGYKCIIAIKFIST